MKSFISKSEALVCSHEALLLVSEKFEHTNGCCVVQLLLYAEYVGKTDQ